MELMLILRVLLRRWWLVLLPVIAAAVLVVPQLLNRGTATTTNFTASFKYSAAQEFNLPQRDGDYQDVWLASEFVVNAFTEWVRSSTFRDEITTIVGTDVDLAPLGIAADNARSIGVVQMSYPDAATLERIVNAAIEVLETRSQVYFPHLGGSPAQVTIVDAPRVVASAPALTNRFAPLLQLGIALLGGILLAFLVEYLDPTLRRAEDLEAQGITVLARVPKS
jgi:capsular polysaccharide biosynthesis protein